MGNDETERDNEENIALDERSDDGDDQDTDVKNFDEPVVLNEDNDREDKDEDDDDDEDDEDEDDKMNDKIKKEGGVFFFSGGMKYLLIIFLEVFIFHFSVKSYSILKGKQTVLKLNDFYQAEKRMLIVMLQCLVKTWLAYLFLSIVFGVFGFEFLKKPLMFLVYSYFIGYAFLDNYNEQHEISIKNSDKIIRKRFGASIALGMLCSLLMLIPVIGPFSSPLFCAVIATLYGYRHQLELVNPK